MAYRVSTILAGVLLTLAVAVADDLQKIPPFGPRVTDLTGTLAPQQTQALNDELEALEKRKGSRMAVLIVATTAPETIEQYTIRVTDVWKLSRSDGRTHDGVLLTVAKDDHRVRIDPGRDLEGAIPDAAAARIIREYITPKFRAGDFYGGIHDATQQLTKLIDGEQLPPPMTNEPDNAPSLPNMLFIGIMGAMWLRGLLGSLPTAVRATSIGGIAGVVAWLMTQAMGISLGCAFVGFVIGLLSGGGGGSYARGGRYGGWSGGGGGWSSGGSSGGGGFSGGSSGGFSGGGASGSW